MTNSAAYFLAAPKTTVKSGYQIQISDASEDADWDAFVLQVPDGHHVQTSLWGQVKALFGWRVKRIIIRKGNRIVAGAQLVIRPLSFIGAIGYVPKGPVVAVKDPDLAKMIIDHLRQVAKANRILYLVVQPPDNDKTFEQLLLQQNFRPSSVDVAPASTVQVALEGSLDEIRSRLKKKVRRYVRYGLKNGLTCREGSENDLSTFYLLMTKTAQKQGFAPFPESYFTEMWRILHPKGHLKLFLVEHKGEPVSAQIVIVFGDTVFAKVVGWSGKYSNLGPNYLLDWTIIEWAHSQGYRYYDLEGIDYELAEAILNNNYRLDPAKHGPAYYKMSFGGQVALFPRAYEYISNPLLRWGYTSVFPKVSGSPLVKKVIGRLRVS